MVSNLGIAGILLSCCALIKMDPPVLCTVGTLAGQLKLKWDGQGVPGHSAQVVPWQGGWS